MVKMIFLHKKTKAEILLNPAFVHFEKNYFFITSATFSPIFAGESTT